MCRRPLLMYCTYTRTLARSVATRNNTTHLLIQQYAASSKPSSPVRHRAPRGKKNTVSQSRSSKSGLYELGAAYASRAFCAKTPSRSSCSSPSSANDSRASSNQSPALDADDAPASGAAADEPKRMRWKPNASTAGPTVRSFVRSFVRSPHTSRDKTGQIKDKDEDNRQKSRVNSLSRGEGTYCTS